MDDWSKQWLAAFNEAMQEWTEAIARDAERTLQQMTNQLYQASDALVEVTDNWAEQVQQALEPEIDRIVDDLNRTLEPLEVAVESQVDEVAESLDQIMGPILTTLLSSMDLWLEEVTAPINRTVDPVLQNHPTCMGCRNYFGQAHGGNMLVCAMHPFGPESDHCSDYESIWPHQRDRSE